MRRAWREAVVACFKVIRLHVTGCYEEVRQKFQYNLSPDQKIDSGVQKMAAAVKPL
jgi:hypothetical protein